MTFWVCPRLDETDGSRLDRLKTFLNHYNKYYVYKEIAPISGKVHYHLAIEVPDVKSYNALKTRWTTTFKDVESTQRSCAKSNGNYHIYVTKGRNRVCSSGITDEELSDIESQSYEVKTSDNKKENFTKYVLDKFNQDFKGLLIYPSRLRMYIEITDWFLELWKSDDKVVQPFMEKVVQGIINTIVIKNSSRIVYDNDDPPVLTSFRDRLLMQFGI